MSPAPSNPPVQEVRWEGRAVVVRIAGDIDLSRSVDFQHELLLLVGQRPDRIVVDLSAVPYMDSSGVASLVKVLSRARKAGTGLVLVGLSVRVQSLFQITRLDRVFQILPTQKEGLA